jgi:predicted MFS family arabinose efflux permease
MDNRQRGKGNGFMVSLQYLGSFLGAAVTGRLWSFGPVVTFSFTAMVILASILLVNFGDRKKQKLISARLESREKNKNAKML